MHFQTVRVHALTCAHCWPQFVFINDVFFCPDDVVRLTHHEATMACGMDMGECAGMLVTFLLDWLRFCC